MASSTTLPSDSMSPHTGRGGLKRVFDVVVASLFLLITAPVFLLIAVAIRLDTPGPVFFRQKRIGRGGRPFQMLKFRKMPVDLPRQGPMLTRRADPRLTRVGRWMERTKFDELPQLFNVIAGEMSMIGPRPEVAAFVDLDHPLWRVVLSVPPGLFGISQIQGRNESSLYPENCDDLEAFYREHILPEKLERDAGYVRRAGVLHDLELLLRGVMVAAFGTVTGSMIRAHAPALGMLFSDVILAGMSLAFAFYVRLRLNLSMPNLDTFWMFLGLALACRTAAFLLMGIYRRRPDTLTYSDVVRLIESTLLSSALLMFLSSLVVPGGLSRTVLLVDTLVLTLALAAKAYGVQQILRAYRTRPRAWALAPAAASIAGALAIDLAGFYVLLLWLSPGQLLVTPIGRFTGLLAGFAAIRAYGICRYGLFRPSAGLGQSLLDLPRVLRASLPGALFLYAADWLFYSELVTVQVLAAEIALSTILLLALNRLAWSWVGPETRERRRVARGARPSTARVLVVGIGEQTEFYLSYLERAGHLEVLGVVDARPGVPRAQTINNVPVIGNLGDLEAFLEARPVDQIVYFPESLAPAQHKRLQATAERRDVPIHPFPDLLRFRETDPAAGVIAEV